jgi:hypothetical protein
VAKDDEKKPAKKPATKPSSGGRDRLRQVKLWVRVVSITVGLFVACLGWMSLIGLLTSNIAVQVVFALVVALGTPTLLADRILKKYGAEGGLGFVADIFGTSLLVMSLLFVGLTPITRPMFRHEGDRMAEGGSKGFARITYWLGGLSPDFPDGPAPAGSGSASASASTGAPK